MECNHKAFERWNASIFFTMFNQEKVRNGSKMSLLVVRHPGIWKKTWKNTISVLSCFNVEIWQPVCFLIRSFWWCFSRQHNSETGSIRSIFRHISRLWSPPRMVPSWQIKNVRFNGIPEAGRHVGGKPASNKRAWPTYACFLKWWYPQNTPKWSFWVGIPMVVGYHHFRNPPI